MNRLWVRLTLAVAGIIGISFGITAFTAQQYFFSEANIRSMVSARLTWPAGLRAQLTEFYISHGSWQGVETVMAGAESTLFLESRLRLTLILTDPEGRVLYAAADPDRPERLDASQLEQALPIKVAGDTVGFLDLVSGERQSRRDFLPSSAEGSPRGFPEQVIGFLLQVFLIVGVLATGFGMLVSRRLSAPLTHLVDGTQAIARRDLSFRVTEEGSTEMRELAYSFNEMAKALEDAETLRRNLLADVAHELRTPLTVLEGNLQAILDDVYPLEKAEIARLYDQTRHLHGLVNDLRLLAQAEARQLPLQRTSEDLVVLLEETADLFYALAGEKGISLHMNLPQSAVFATVDRVRLAQTLQNLLTNALKHTAAGGVISLSLRAEEKSATIAVADNGEGIASEDIAFVFDRFYRVDKNRTRDTGGVGLGLAIAQALVEAHDGRIDAASAGLGQGSTFTVRLPLA